MSSPKIKMESVDSDEELAADTSALDIATEDGADPDETNEQTKPDRAVFKWGEGKPAPAMRVDITNSLLAQVCPADLADEICDFDFVMPNQCDHCCEMLRLCQVYAEKHNWECPNTDTDTTLCPYVHNVKVSCASVKQESSCSKADAEECPQGHDLQAARQASHASLQNHQAAGQTVYDRKHQYTFEENQTHAVTAQQQQQPAATNAEPLPADASTELFIGLKRASTTDAVRTLFASHRGLVDVRVPTDASKRCAFVEFASMEESRDAFAALENTMFEGGALRIRFAKKRAKTQGNGGAQGSGSGGGGRACFTCGEVGHMKRECPRGAEAGVGTGDGG